MTCETVGAVRRNTVRLDAVQRSTTHPVAPHLLPPLSEEVTGTAVRPARHSGQSAHRFDVSSPVLALPGRKFVLLVGAGREHSPGVSTGRADDNGSR